MLASQGFPSFCVFCYQSIYICAESANSSESVHKFTKFISRFKTHKDLDKLLSSECKSGRLLNSKLQCCHDCNIIIDGFCAYYHQFEVLELQLNWKLKQLGKMIKHCNRVPSRWTKMNTYLEQQFPVDTEMRLKSQTFIRKFREYIEETCHPRELQPQLRVLLEVNNDFTKNFSTAKRNSLEENDVNNAITEDHTTTSGMEIEEDMSHDNLDDDNVEYSDQEQSAHSIDTLVPVKLEPLTATPPVCDEVDIEMQTDQSGFLDDFNSINTQNVLPTPTTSAHQQKRYSLRNKRTSQSLKLEITNAGDDDSDADFPSELYSGQLSSDNESEGDDNDYQDYDEDEPNFKSFSKISKRKSQKSKSNHVRETKKLGLECPTCKMYFTLNSAYKNHMKNSDLCTDEDHDKIGDWKCSECDLLCGTKKKLWLHRINDHEEKICVECGREFKVRQDLNIHLQYHKEPIKCTHCSKTFQTKEILVMHLRFTHSKIIKRSKEIKPKTESAREKSFQCGKCSTQFRNEHVYQTHLYSQAEGEFQCSFCPTVLTNVLKLSTHEYQTHCPEITKEKDEQSETFQWTCPRCQYKSTCCPDYQSHFAQTHFKIENPKCLKLKKDKKCKLCNKAFTTTEDLDIHIEKIHTKSNLKCTKCGKTFATIKYLNRHLNRHKKKKNLQFKPNIFINEQSEQQVRKTCEICDRVLESFGRKKQHLKECHDLPGNTDKSKHLNCNVNGCTAYFLTETQLVYHRVAKHNFKLDKKGISVKKSRNNPDKTKHFQCPKCNKTLPSWKAFGRHKNSRFCEQEETGSFKCEDCDLTWSSKKELWVHRSEDHENIICLECGQKFNSKLHLSLHLVYHKDPKEWEWECSKCLAKFARKMNLKRHIQTVHKYENFADIFTKSEAKANELKPKSDLKCSTKAVTCMCTNCGKGFRNKQVYWNHLYSQTIGKFQCEFCPHVESNVIKLSSHECQSHCKSKTSEQSRSEDDNKPFKWSCPRCEFQSNGCVEYQSHFALVHFKLEDPKCAKVAKIKQRLAVKHRCEKCGKTFSSSFGLKKHVKYVHGKKTFTCENCGRMFPALWVLNKHLKTCKDKKK